MTAVRGFTDVSTIDEQEHRITVTVADELLKNIPSYDRWQQESKIIDKKETELPQDTSIPLSASMHISNAQDIALKLATYHMESHTMIENMQFLAGLIAGIEYRN